MKVELHGRVTRPELEKIADQGNSTFVANPPGYVKEFYDPTTGAHYVETPRGLELFSANNPSAWQPIQTAPKDGTPFWAWLHQTGIRKLKFYADDPEWDSGFAECHNPREWWEPEFWLPLEAIPEPPQ